MKSSTSNGEVAVGCTSFCQSISTFVLNVACVASGFKPANLVGNAIVLVADTKDKFDIGPR